MTGIFSVLELEPECSVRPTEVRCSASAAECHQILQVISFENPSTKEHQRAMTEHHIYCEMK